MWEIGVGVLFVICSDVLVDVIGVGLGVWV